MSTAAIPSDAQESNSSWSDVFHVEYGGRKFYVGRRPGQVNFSLRFEHNRKAIVRSLKTPDARTAGKNATHLLRQIFTTDWDTAEKQRKLARQKTTADLLALYRQRFEENSPADRRSGATVFKYFLGSFGPRLLCDVTVADLDKHIRSIGNNNTRAKHFTYLFGFFRWANQVEYIAGNPMTRLDRPKTTPRRNILSASQMQEILSAEARMPDWMFAAMLLGGFAGLRTAEICRMRWEDVDVLRSQIDVRHAKGSDATPFAERIVDMQAPLLRRAAFFEKDKAGNPRTGRIIPGPDDDGPWFCTERAKIVADVLKWEKWPENCLRHSFATYHLALVGDPNRTAFQMGHSSPAMVCKVYAVPAKRRVAQDWWDL